MNPKLGKTMGDLDVEAKRWERRVKDRVYKLVTKYECEWTDEIAADTNIQEHLKHFNLSDPITPRSALYGGRTEAICLHAVGSKAEPIKYINVVGTVQTQQLMFRYNFYFLVKIVLRFLSNVIFYFFQTSLYPSVCKRMKYPVGHPRCLIGPSLDGYNIHNLEGVVRCTYYTPTTDVISTTVTKQSQPKADVCTMQIMRRNKAD